MIKFAFNIILIISSSLSIAQVTVIGFVKSNDYPISYANIGIVGAGVGTVTDEKGMFTLYIPDNVLDNQIIISSIGYKTRKYENFKAFNEEVNEKGNIFLIKEIGELAEIIVLIKKPKKKPKKIKYKYAIGFDSGKLGNEIAILKHVEYQQQLLNLKINVVSNLNEKIIFRLNIHEKSNAYPAEKINKQNIFIKLERNKIGEIDIDLSNYDLMVDGDYFISLECIEDTDFIRFLGEKNEGTFLRTVSFDFWKKSVIGFDCVVTYK